MRRQLASVGRAVERGDRRLYLDLPARRAPATATTPGATATLFAWAPRSAPRPTTSSPRGQNWGFPPAAPASGPRATATAYLDRVPAPPHARTPALLRLDHVMGLHRLYWVPRRHARPPRASTCAIRPRSCRRALPSSRTGTRRARRRRGPRHRARRGARRHATPRRPAACTCCQFAARRGARTPLARARPAQVASIDTHDTPTVRRLRGAATTSTAARRPARATTGRATAARPRRRRRSRRAAVRGRSTRLRAAGAGSRSATATPRVLVTLDDLWRETRAAERARHDRPSDPQLASPGTRYGRRRTMLDARRPSCSTSPRPMRSEPAAARPRRRRRTSDGADEPRHRRRPLPVQRGHPPPPLRAARRPPAHDAGGRPGTLLRGLGPERRARCR